MGRPAGWQKQMTGRDILDVGDPKPIRALGHEPPIDPIQRTRRSAIGTGGADGPFHADRVPGRGVRSVSRSGRRVIVSGLARARVRLRVQAG